MRHEQFPSIPDQRFQKRPDSARTGTHRNAVQMLPDFATNLDEPVVPAKEWVRPRAADYLWRRWYAKLWWAAILTYWLGMAASSFVPMLADFYASALAGFLNVLFYPITALLVLGVGFARAWLDRIEWGGEGRAAMHEELFPRSFYDPYTDPGNPLSGAIYRSAHGEDTMRHR